MDGPDPPRMEDMLEFLREIARAEGGERFLNCVLQRLAPRVNQLPMRELAMAVHIRGGASIVYAPNLERLRQEFSVADPAELAERSVLARVLHMDVAEFRSLRTAVEARLRELTANAALRCAEAG